MLLKAALNLREESGISGFRGGKNVAEGCKKTSFSRMTRLINILRLVEVW